jgi:alanyl-tRNA synthetase
MSSHQIRQDFLNYFKEKGHAVVASSSVVPHDDPTLLFTNAGMNQFKDVFLAKSTRDYVKATTSQKCIRVGGKHNDLDNVGHTSRHLTFFEMLGNFSFGDYFKKEAIAYAWEVSTQVFGFNPDKIWPTVFQEDDEAFEMWKKIVPEKRIIRMGEKDNFWAMGDTGPCGPCSELLYDRGEKYGTAASPKEDVSGERYLEFWNLVFMQYNRDGNGILSPLPKQSIDTGSGLERVVSLKMGVDSVFATDIFRSLIAQIEQVSGKVYTVGDAAFHVIADHIRSLSFAIADGAQPSNIERGYVLRKILRRAVRYGRALGMQEPFLAKVLPRLVEVMGPHYRELVEASSRIAEILTIEEEAFLRTLKRGGNILNTVIDKGLKSPLKQISGEEAFKLKDTYGFPLEEILLIAKDTGLAVNLESYELLEEAAKEKSRGAKVQHTQEVTQDLYRDFAEKKGAATFLGYTEAQAEAIILGILVQDTFVDTLKSGEEGILLLDKTPFYAEKGGQVGDRGTLSAAGAQFTVTSCTSPYPGVIAHRGKLETGEMRLAQRVLAAIDTSYRLQIANNHTATHLLHWALQKVLGEHIRQAGSLVEAKRLRFDFSHHKAISAEELQEMEKMINEKIREDLSVRTYELSYEEAQTKSDIKQFFGDKYGSKVRVIDIEYSKELCGGTHTSRTGTIGLFRIAKEGSIASGVRRIEAITGRSAEEFMYQNEELAHKSAALLKVPTAKLPERLASLMQENLELQAKLKELKQGALLDLAKTLAKGAKKIGSALVVAEVVPVSQQELPPLAELLASHMGSSVLMLAFSTEGKCQLLIKVSPDLVQKGIQAVTVIKEICPLIEGSGGGKADNAQAGGKKPEGLPAAFERAKTLIAQLC